MKKLISPKVMQACERAFFAESGVRSIDIMENAARALADAILSTAGLEPGARVYIACGKGNNGGDGLACARLLKDAFRCTVFLAGVPATPDAIENYALVRSCGIPVFTLTPDDRLASFSAAPTPDRPYPLPVPAGENPPDRPPDLWVDALLGTGGSRPPEGGIKALIECINRDAGDSRSLVYAADIPTGLNGATGEAAEPCVRADCTVAFQFQKTGTALADGLDVCGKVITADVGLPESAFGPFDACLAGQLKSLDLLETRPRNIHKGSCGHLLIVAGSVGMAGAAAMCAKAALRSGAGLVTVACGVSIVPILQTLVPQAMCLPLPEACGVLAGDCYMKLLPALEGKTAVVVGPGLSSGADVVVGKILESGLPAVIDADALNCLARRPDSLFPLLKPQHVLTPHPGEAKRLLRARSLSLRSHPREDTQPYLESRDREALPPELTSSPIAMASELSKLGATVLYKGAASVIRDERDVFISTTGCCGMARGGSGDILAGVLGALLAAPGKRTVVQNALIASEIHGIAGEYAQAHYGPYAMNAMDILEYLPEAFPR